MKKVVLIGLMILAAGCQAASTGGNSPNPSNNLAGLRTFENCGELSRFLQERVGAESAPLPAEEEAPLFGVEDEAGSADAPAAPTASVEEGDIVKKEGDRLYVVTLQGRLLVYDVSDPGEPKRIGEFELSDFAQEMYIDGAKVVIIGTPPIATIWMPKVPYQPVTRVLVLNFSDPASPAVLRQYDLNGTYTDSRKVGSAVYLVLQNWVGGPEIETRVEEKGSCETVYAPIELDSGDYISFTSWDLFGIDLDLLPEDPNRVSVIGSYGSTVYSTPEHFYLTNYFYEKTQTGIYLFDLDPSSAAIAPRANASIPGSIVNQFSMDETEGIFRIASTVRVFDEVGGGEGTVPMEGGPTVAALEPIPTPSETTNYLTTFRASDGSLTQLGQIDTIVPGESITAVRFVGSRAFATTFVIIDPLVTIDLSDPASPKVMGELHLPGMTTYMEEWGDLLIAIGASDGWWGNVVLNLFDVSDLANPVLIEQEILEDTYGSEAQFEHQAFAFVEGRAVLAIPVYTSTGSEMQVFKVDPESGFSLLGVIRHDDLIPSETPYSPLMRRGLEIGAYLYSISEAGMKVNAFDNLSEDLFGELFAPLLFLDLPTGRSVGIVL